MYANCLKRVFDFLISFVALVILSPLLLILIILGAIKMKGNPFFTQLRPGKNEKIFRLIKFRSMTCEKDNEGKLLPDAQRLTKYGKFIRKTSLDELPELINILKGDMAIVGPRPLVVQYLPYYNEEEKHRHDVRPGLTGLAQVNGRNATTWEERFHYDLIYVNKVTFIHDIKILCMTVGVVFKRTGIGVRGVNSLEDFDVYRKKQEEKQ